MTGKATIVRQQGAVVQQLSFDQVAGPFCQRWQGGVPTWKHPDQGGFNRSLYEIAEIADDTTAAAFIFREHYSHSYPAALRRFGLYRRDKLVGVAVFGIPTNTRTLTLPFPDLIPYKQSAELSRFVLTDADCPSNSETFFLWQCLHILKRDGMRGVVAFSDPVPRRNQHGTTVFAGHYGHIYRSGSAIYAGRGTPRTLLLLPNGHVLNDRSVQKVRAQEPGHEGVEELLVEHGARPLRSDEDPHRWLKEALETIHVQRLRHPGCHRYLFDLSGRVRRQRIGLPILPYPYRCDGGH